MNTAGRKAKGRFLQNLVRDKFRKIFKEQLEDDDIKAALMGDSGEDIKWSPAARKLIPFSIECKNQEAFSISSAIKQAETNCKDKTRIPLVIFKKKYMKPHISMSLDNFLKLLYNFEETADDFVEDSNG
jgi:hypothetical protein